VLWKDLTVPQQEPPKGAADRPAIDPHMAIIIGRRDLKRKGFVQGFFGNPSEATDAVSAKNELKNKWMQRSSKIGSQVKPSTTC
jgi:hypothetical protein